MKTLQRVMRELLKTYLVSWQLYDPLKSYAKNSNKAACILTKSTARRLAGYCSIT